MRPSRIDYQQATTQRHWGRALATTTVCARILSAGSLAFLLAATASAQSLAGRAPGAATSTLSTPTTSLLRAGATTVAVAPAAGRSKPLIYMAAIEDKVAARERALRLGSVMEGAAMHGSKAVIGNIGDAGSGPLPPCKLCVKAGPKAR
jgi:hypothetical protein